MKMTKNKSFALEWDEDAAAYRVEKLTSRTHESVGKHAGGLPAEPAMQLTQCLRAFTKQETLSENDPWYCSDCKKHQCATKKFDLWKLPNILIIHLKRFSYTRIMREKITAFVDFPIEGL